MATNYTFLLVSKRSQTLWPLALQQALTALGELHIVSEEEAVQATVRGHYDMVIVDAVGIHDVASLVSRLRAHKSRVCVVVATASPTWQRAREAIKAGAADYILKSLDEDELRSKIRVVLELPSPLESE